MKYKIGDVLFMKNCDYKPRLRLHLHLRPRPHLHPRLGHFIQNAFGIITKVYKHSDLFERDSTEDDNLYVWLSQVDAREYRFYENEVEGEVTV